MLNKLAQIETKFEKTEAELAMPESVSDQEKFKALMREHKKLSPIVEKYREYKSSFSDQEDAELLLEEETDADDDRLFLKGFHSCSPSFSCSFLEATRRMAREPAMAAMRMKLSPRVS